MEKSYKMQQILNSMSAPAHLATNMNTEFQEKLINIFDDFFFHLHKAEIKIPY